MKIKSKIIEEIKMLSIKNVTKRYSNGFTALSDFSLDAQNGVIGLLGSNGAGKSTLMKMIAAVSRPTGGHIYWNGKDIMKNGDELRHDLGYLPQDFGVFPNLNAVEFLNYMAALKGMNMKKAKNRIDELISILNLESAAKKRMGTYSGGMKQRVGIAQAFLNDPKLLILDEPTVGLDPEERLNFRNLICSFAESKIVILSTHIVSDVELTAEKIALLSRGRLLCFSKNEDLLASIQGNVWEVLLPQNEAEMAMKKYITGNITRRSKGIKIRIISETKPFPNAVSVQPALEDAYLYYMNGKRGGSIE